MQRYISLALLFICWTTASAQQIAAPQMAQASSISAAVRGLDTQVTLDLRGVTLEKALQEIGKQASLRVFFGEVVAAHKSEVTLRVRNTPARSAIEQVLKGTGIGYKVTDNGQVFFERDEVRKSVRGQGVIVGKVTDAKSGKGVSGATVSVGNDTRGVSSGEDGAYRITGIAAGLQTVTVRLVGYAKQTRTVTVGEGTTVSADFRLEPSANVLDQVIVTGTVVQTELKAVPSAITVITAKQIEDRGITKIDQLFRGDIPGLFAMNIGSNAPLDEVTMFSRGATALSAESVPGSLAENSNPIKTYVDGIELADPKYLSQIDPKNIERIEILTGPQASTIYGSNALNGVMQIFTKRGNTSRPQLTLNLMSGWVENNFSTARVSQHDYTAQLSGIEGRLSYNAGGSWTYMGPWTPAKQFARIGGFGGSRLDFPTPVGRVTADMTLRRSITRSLQRGATNQTVTGYRETGWWSNITASGVAQPTMRTLTGQTVGLTLSYAPASWWSHELGLGTDASDIETRRLARGYSSLSDTTLFLSQDHMDRRSIRYVTTVRLPVASLAQFTVTAGADAWNNLTSSISVSPQTLTGTLAGEASVSRQPGHNAGGFLQTQLGLNDRLFVTYGLRAEWNPGYGEEQQPNFAPRYGVAYTQEFGAITAKLRGSYGRSTRPPQPTQKTRQTIAEVFGSSWSSVSSSFLPYYDSIFDYRIANSNLAPEHQQGGEGGLELYLGSRGSLVITRYNQTVDGLIAQPLVDSVRTSVLCVSPCQRSSLDADGYGYWRQLQYINIGSIRNQGWELQGSINVGPVTTRGTYSWTKSRTIGVSPRYRASFVNQPQYIPGATFQYLPEHTWALGVAYALAKSSIGLNVTGMGRVTNFRDDFYTQNLNSSIRLPQNRFNVSNADRYVSFNTGYALVDLTASHHFVSRVEGVLQVQNLTDRYTNDYYAVYASLGRQVKAGMRVRTQ